MNILHNSYNVLIIIFQVRLWSIASGKRVIFICGWNTLQQNWVKILKCVNHMGYVLDYGDWQIYT